MIKGLMAGNGGILLFMGLSHDNLDKLRQGLPIVFGGADIGLHAEIPFTFMIFSGKDEASIVEDMKKAVPNFNPDDIVYGDAKAKEDFTQ